MELTALLAELCRLGGSDLHLVSGSVPRFRVDGYLRPMESPKLTSQDMSRLTESLLTEVQHHQVTQTGEWDGAYSVPAIGRFRIHVYTQRGSLAMAIRTVSGKIPTFEELGLPPTVEELMRKPQGLILVTGPTGSGKSTTLASMLDRVNEERHAHIISLEDPIEILHSHKKSLVSQMEVGSDIREFQAALKGILRQDPDVVFLGELRDLETIQAALTMAETGHLTVATLHTNSAIHTLTRLVSVFPPHHQQEIRIQLSMVLEGILAQRLLPRSEGKGRVLALEILIPSPAIRNLIREDKIHQMYSMMQTGQAQYGMQTMNQALADLAGQGMISSKLAMGLTTLPEELSKLLDRTGRDRLGAMSLARLRPRM
ncbi:MAG: type IV pilus twitching motility protein PilT [Nitrospira sp.]|nr:type IV pilus twitching motility protein PilT [Nitrospira sp.]